MTIKKELTILAIDFERNGKIMTSPIDRNANKLQKSTILVVADGKSSFVLYFVCNIKHAIYVELLVRGYSTQTS